MLCFAYCEGLVVFLPALSKGLSLLYVAPEIEVGLS